MQKCVAFSLLFARDVTLSAVQRSDIDRVIRELYAGSMAVPLASFMGFALELLQGLISFDSAMWASGTHEPQRFHTAHFLNQPDLTAKLHERRLAIEDLACKEARCQYGKAVMHSNLVSRQAFEALPSYAALFNLSGIEQQIAFCTVSKVTGLVEFVSVWRKRLDAPFTELDREVMEVITAHLVAAWGQATQFHLKHEPKAKREAGQAMFDHVGILRMAENGFLAMLRRYDPHWQGLKLPKNIVRIAQSLLDRGPAQIEPKEHKLGDFTLFVKTYGPLFLARLSGPKMIDRLSPSEQQVALLFSQGKDNKGVAQQLGVAQATARNQLASVYRKLGVSNRTELVTRLT